MALYSQLLVGNPSNGYHRTAMLIGRRFTVVTVGNKEIASGI